MPPTSFRQSVSLLLLLAALANASPQTGVAERPVDYTRDIKPLLADRCYACHGPDAGNRQADLRLDVRESATDLVIEPGDADNSYLIERIAAEDPADLMPPPDSHKPPLTSQQVELIRRWINEGAKFDEHWAYVVPTRTPVPEVKNTSWPRGAIDRLVAAGHEAHGVAPSPEADRPTLLRRLGFDLTGLPPRPEEIAAFAADTSPDAYEKQVERLLASPHFGERMAVYWLDLARYADTGGYHSDNHRDVWLYRDYVIRAFNENKPFDEFVGEQLAGDLLPEPTRWQRIASGYNRLLQTTEEGGAQPKEYQAKYDADRVRNTSSAFLGATIGCAECHDHKFDPYTARDFYRFAAFFADIQEKPVGRQDQTRLPTAEHTARITELDREIAAVRKAFAARTRQLDAAQRDWESSLTAVRPVHADGVDGLPKEAAAAIAVAPDQRSDAQASAIAAYYRTIAPDLADERKRLADLESQKQAVLDAAPTSLISIATNPRTIRVLPRGNWLDDSGEIVEPGIPAFLGKLDVAGRRPTRLDLARWMTDRKNPLVARVWVNRLWKLFFGRGIVKSVDDFGSQGSLPSHPELLDWLAVELIESGWDVKHMVRLITTSATYRQSSMSSRDLRGRDPENLWLARQGRFRLSAEFVRDNALAISGLLSAKIGGPSVKPYQPEGYWMHLNFPKREYVHDHGEDQYRRGLYTYWQRSFLHPSLLAFDASSREECTAERPRSNTPLQSLVLLNDPTYVEAARVFAARILREAGESEAERIDYAFHRALGRGAEPPEQDVLSRLYQKHHRQYSDDEAAVKALLGVGEYAAPSDPPAAELAAWTSVARTILNLHETITRP